MLYGMTHLKAIGVTYRKMRKFIANKDNSSFVFSIIAIVFSAISLAYSIYQGNVDISRERYEFWTHVNKKQEIPRFCRGDSRCLTYSGVHRRTDVVSRQAHNEGGTDGRGIEPVTGRQYGAIEGRRNGAT